MRAQQENWGEVTESGLDQNTSYVCIIASIKEIKKYPLNVEILWDWYTLRQGRVEHDKKRLKIKKISSCP